MAPRRRHLTMAARARPQVGLIHLAHQIDTEAVVGLLVDQPEPPGQVDAARGGERMVGPQLQPRVTGQAGEVHALVDEPSAEMAPAGRRVHQEDPELSRGLVGGNAEHAPDPAAVRLGDPGGLPGWVAAGRVVGDDPRDDRLEGGIPAELGRVHLAVGHHHPAEVTRPPQAAYLSPRPERLPPRSSLLRPGGAAPLRLAHTALPARSACPTGPRGPAGSATATVVSRAQ